MNTMTVKSDSILAKHLNLYCCCRCVHNDPAAPRWHSNLCVPHGPMATWLEYDVWSDSVGSGRNTSYFPPHFAGPPTVSLPGQPHGTHLTRETQVPGALTPRNLGGRFRRDAVAFPCAPAPKHYLGEWTSTIYRIVRTKCVTRLYPALFGK